MSDESETQEGRDSLQGWVKMHRMYANEPVFQDEHLWRLYSWLMFYARHQAGAISVKSGTGKRIFRLLPGQVVTGRKQLARALNWADSNVKNRLEKLRSLGVISIEVDSQFSIVTVTNYQDDQFVQPLEVDNQRTTKGQPKTSQRTIKGQPKDNRRTQRKNVENDDNEKNENHDLMERESSGDAADSPTIQKILDLIDQYMENISVPQDLLSPTCKKNLALEFFHYWDCKKWRNKGKPIKLIAEVNKWTQRKISEVQDDSTLSYGQKLGESMGI